jgi:hypothetical protein
MWICWTDPETGQRQRIYNFFDPKEQDGILAIGIARNALGNKFGVKPDAIPDFRVERTSWESMPARESVLREPA